MRDSHKRLLLNGNERSDFVNLIAQTPGNVVRLHLDIAWACRGYVHGEPGQFEWRAKLPMRHGSLRPIIILDARDSEVEVADVNDGGASRRVKSRIRAFVIVFPREESTLTA